MSVATGGGGQGAIRRTRPGVFFNNSVDSMINTFIFKRKEQTDVTYIDCHFLCHPLTGTLAGFNHPGST